jgi:hypothetical protein
MKVHFGKGLGIGYLLLSLILGGMSTFMLLSSQNNLDRFLYGFLSFCALLCFIGGIIILAGKVYFEVDSTSLVISAPLGPLKKTVQFQSLKELSVVTNKVFLVRDGRQTKVQIFTYMADKSEWDRFIRGLLETSSI